LSVPNPKSKKVKYKAIKLVKKIWKFSKKVQMTKEGGRVEETRVTGPSREEREFEEFSPIKGPYLLPPE